MPPTAFRGINILQVVFCLALLVTHDAMAQKSERTAGAEAQTLWLIDNTTSIGGHPVTVKGTPQIIRSPKGDSVRFNGRDDGLMVSNNPLAGMTSFTVELIFKHDPLTVPTANEPRIVHIQTPGGSAEAHRFTMETRVSTATTPHTFHLDSFLRFGAAEDSRLTLFNTKFPHPVGEWTHMAVTYDGTNFSNYLNGQRELSGVVKGLVFADGGVTWIGQRANNVNYFQGEVRVLRFTPRVLSPEEFMSIQSAPRAN
jgi:Concanavalin A-like lectin/glucanases superfamily